MRPSEGVEDNETEWSRVEEDLVLDAMRRAVRLSVSAGLLGEIGELGVDLLYSRLANAYHLLLHEDFLPFPLVPVSFFSLLNFTISR